MALKQVFFALLSGAIGFTLTSPIFAEAQYATKAEFVAAVAGKTIFTKTKTGKPFSAVYDAKGTGTFTLADAGPEKFTWSFKGDTICSVYKKMKFTECNKVEIVGPAELKFIDAKTGKLNNEYSVK